MKTPRRYAPMGGSFAPVRVAGFRWYGWQASAVYAQLAEHTLTGFFLIEGRQERCALLGREVQAFAGGAKEAHFGGDIHGQLA
jgi:hypothetical protein